MKKLLYCLAALAALVITPAATPHGKRAAAPHGARAPKVVFFDDFITVQQGTSESNLLLSTYGAPPSARLVDRLATAAAQRLAEH